MPDSGKFKDLYLNSAHTYPCQTGGAPCGANFIIICVINITLMSRLTRSELGQDITFGISSNP